MSVSSGIVPLAEIRFADGKRYFVAPAPVSEFLLDPVFLKFFLSCLLIYGLLDWDVAAETARQMGFATIVLWAIVAAISLVWFATVLAVLRLLWRHGWVRVIYTPFITLTIFAVTAVATHVFLNGLGSPLSSDGWVDELVRDMIVIVIMDVMFGSFVAPLHPVFITTKGAGAEAAPKVATATVPATPPEMAEADQGAADAEEAQEMPVRIGTEEVLPSDLIYIRAEDHYLRVVTTRRRILTRGRLSDALANLDFRRGLQVNRSTWVAFSAIETVGEDDKGILSLTLTGGESERVAQSRRIAFQTAMAAWAAPTAD